MTKAQLLNLLILFLAVLPLLGAVAMKELDSALNADIMRALLDLLDRHHIEPKQAMEMFGGYDKSQWSRICSGQLPAPSITRIASGLTWPMFGEFVPEWTRIVARHKFAAVDESMSLRRSA